jgi:hypothetical protein
MELIKSGRLLLLYTLKLRVADPIEVKTVSKVMVSAENEGSALGSGSSISRLQVKARPAIMMFINNLKQDFFRILKDVDGFFKYVMESKDQTI